MRFWIFKAIWAPMFLAIGIGAMAVVGLIFKDSGWEVPFRWMCLIGILAFIADKVVNP